MVLKLVSGQTGSWNSSLHVHIVQHKNSSLFVKHSINNSWKYVYNLLNFQLHRTETRTVLAV